jgi:Arylsulfotransferase (ASST)
VLALAAPAVAQASVDVYPSVGTRVASPDTQISLRGIAPSQVHGVTITGRRSGKHSFKVKAHSDGNGVSLLPTSSFRPGERVRVRAPFDLSGSTNRQVTFRVARFPSGVHKIYIPDPGGTPKGVQRFHTERGLLPPQLVVRRRSGATAPGDLFVAPKGGPGQNGPMIADDNGALVWYRALPDGNAAFDFRTQTYRGRPVLTWWQGRVLSPGMGQGVGMILDDRYRTVARVRAGNGYQADLHEFQLTPEGTALMLAYQPVYWSREAVMDAVIQEVDVRTGLVEFEWHSVGRVDTSDSYFRRTPGGPYDYIHANSVQEAFDGSLVVSGRGTHAIYDVDRHTGNIVWQLGGKKSTFAMGPGAQFVAQHDARLQPDGTVTIFDNGAPPVTARRARGLELAIDTATRTATLVRSFTHAQPGLGSESQGSTQELPDGHFLVYWGNHSWLSEYDASGKLLLDAQFQPDGDDSYRAYRLPWSARPAATPRVVAATKASASMVWASWNGATGVAAWQVLAGSSKTALGVVATAPRRGFETGIGINGAPRYVQVRALGADGTALATSSVVTPAKH